MTHDTRNKHRCETGAYTYYLYRETFSRRDYALSDLHFGVAAILFSFVPERVSLFLSLSPACFENS